MQFTEAAIWSVYSGNLCASKFTCYALCTYFTIENYSLAVNIHLFMGIKCWYPIYHTLKKTIIRQFKWKFHFQVLYI